MLIFARQNRPNCVVRKLITQIDLATLRLMGGSLPISLQLYVVQSSVQPFHLILGGGKEGTITRSSFCCCVHLHIPPLPGVSVSTSLDCHLQKLVLLILHIHIMTHQVSGIQI